MSLCWRNDPIRLRSQDDESNRIFYQFKKRMGLLRHCFLNFIGRAGQAMAQHDQFAVLPNSKNVLNADTQLFFRNVNPWLKGKDHAFIERQRGIVGIMNVQAHVMSQSVDEIFSQRFAMKIFAMGIDVIKRHLIQRIWIGAVGA
jgi:hypothetical protein